MALSVPSTPARWVRNESFDLGHALRRWSRLGQALAVRWHYTNSDKIMRIIELVFVRPRLAEWQTAKTEVAVGLIHFAFIVEGPG